MEYPIHMLVILVLHCILLNPTIYIYTHNCIWSIKYYSSVTIFLAYPSGERVLGRTLRFVKNVVAFIAAGATEPGTN